MQVADGLLLVTNPEYPAIAACAKSIEYAKMLKVPMTGVVLNKVRNKSYELTPEQIEKSLKKKLIEIIPMNNRVPESIANKIPIVLFKPHNKASLAYKRLAAYLIDEKYHSHLSSVLFP